MIENEQERHPTDVRFLINSNIIFDQIQCELSHGDERIKIAYTESKILETLILNLNDIVPRDTLIELSWGERIVTDASLAKSISNLRKALKNIGLDGDTIITVPRLGYRLILPVEPIHSPKINSEQRPQQNKNRTNSTRIIGKIRRNIEQFIDFFNSKIKLISATCYLFSALILTTSILNITLGVEHNLERKHLSPGYKEEPVTINEKKYTIISPKGYNLSLERKIISIISLAPSESTIFIQRKGDYYNLLFSKDKSTSSFIFQEKNIEKARCKVKSVLSKGNFVCEQ